MAKKQYYDITNLLSTKAQYLMLLGQRANGKSYQVKETVIKDYIENGNRFVYLRRFKADIKQSAVESYFLDMPIEKYTKGEYEGICAYQGSFYFYNRDEETGKLIKGNNIGQYCALNEATRYKSNVFDKVKNIVYEEFITDSVYLTDEPRLLQQFVSTVLRRVEGTVFLIGNTLSRVCPYFGEWSLNGVLKQKQGTIEVYNYHTKNEEGKESVVKVAVENCATTNYENNMFFGKASKQIVSGEWDVHELPKLPRLQEEYEKVYECLVEYQSFCFVLNLLVEPIDGGMIVFIYPRTEKSKKKILRKITRVFSDNIFESATLNPHNVAESHIIDCFRLGKVCYSDNLTGEDFKHVNEELHIVPLI